VKILHTADWHVGKVLKSHSRLAEHRAVLADLVRIADAEDVDVVIVAGDLFETSAPSPQAQGLVMSTLLALRGEDSRRHVVALAGNHDNPELVDGVYRPVLGELGVHVLGRPKRPDRGGAITVTTRRGETARIAALPFLSYRFAVRAAEAVLHEAADHALDYARQVEAIIRALGGVFSDDSVNDSVNIVTTHGTVLGGRRGGGEREVQTLLGYELPRTVFPATAHYAALGHLHRYQEIDGPCPIVYSGSPLALDFGEEANEPVALVVTATPGSRAHVRPVPVTGGRALRTLRGTLDEVIAASEDEGTGEALLRVILAEQARAGLGDLVREKLPNAIDVQLAEQYRPRRRNETERGRLGRSPLEQFAAFLAERNVADERVSALFAELLDEVTASDAMWHSANRFSEMPHRGGSGRGGSGRGESGRGGQG
jgi:DNA repair protein SbcD/Mre11